MAETMEKGKIYSAIPAIMGELDAIGKNKRNEQQRFMYRGIDDVMNALNPVLVKNRVFIVPEILEQTREERTTSKGGALIYSVCRIKFHFCADDGSEVCAVTAGEGMDSGDKATNKAMSIAFKYACFQVFCIPTEEMADPDSECHDVTPKGAPKGEPKGATRAQGNAQTGARTGARQETAAEAAANERMREQANSALIDEAHMNALKSMVAKKGLHEESILKKYGVEDFSSMTFENWNDAMKILDKYPNKDGSAA